MQTRSLVRNKSEELLAQAERNTTVERQKNEALVAEVQRLKNEAAQKSSKSNDGPDVRQVAEGIISKLVANNSRLESELERAKRNATAIQSAAEKVITKALSNASAIQSAAQKVIAQALNNASLAANASQERDAALQAQVARLEQDLGKANR